MHGGIRIGRILGINIRVDWSWIFIFLLVTWSLGASVFPQAHPNWDPSTSWVLAIVASLLFFASILTHELAHSAVAKAKGLPVSSITLFLFGGVSNIEHEPQSAGVEFQMAIVGPLTSLLLGVVFLLLGGAGVSWSRDPMKAFAGLNPVSTMLMWLGPINILLGLFNLIPGFPLDGGRVLRSILWATTGNLHKATRWASATGQFIAWVFIVTGISMVFGFNVPVFGTGLIGGLWLAFIGWFLNSAAASTYRQMLVNDLLEDVPVSRLMRVNAPVVASDMIVAGLVNDWIMKTDLRSFAVVNDGKLSGMVSLEDVRKLPPDAWATTPISEIMTPAEGLVSFTPSGSVAKALSTLVGRDVQQGPVVEDGKVIGMLQQRDILKWLQLHSGSLQGV